MSSLTHRGVNVQNIFLWIALLLGSAGIVTAIAFGEVRLAVTAVVFTLILALSTVDLRLSILGLFVFLTLLGDLRRLLVPMVGWSGADPILMVTPVFTVLLTGYAIISRRLSTSSTLSRCMLLFTGIMMLQIVNPNQGDLTVGVAGAVLVIVPTFWFWIGQAYGSERFLKTFLFSLVIPLSVLALTMGFIQIAYGYLPYQLEWYRLAGYTALGDSLETLRPISIFPNITEFLLFIAVSVVLFASALLHKGASTKIKQASFFLLPLGLTALLLGGSRGPLAMSIIVIVLMWAVKGRSVATWAPRLAVAGLLGVMGFAWSLNQVSDLQGSARVQASLQRQAALVETGGTATIHANLAWSALYHGVVKEPFGMGIGSITLAAAKFDGTGFNSEKDITNMFIATGVFGGVVYLILVIIVAVTAIRYWIRTRSLMALAIFGVLAVTGLNWLNAGHYVMTPLIWFVIGALDRLSSTSSRSTSSSTASE